MVPSVDDIFALLAPHSEVLENALLLAGSGKLPGRYDSREIAQVCGISSSKLPAVIAALQAAEGVGAATRDVHGMWGIALQQDAARDIALMMRGVRIHKKLVRTAENSVKVVISRPAAPSRLISELERTLEGLWGIEDTALTLGEMAASATRCFTVMSPFVDEDGAERIIRLFQATGPSVSRELVIRDQLPPALAPRVGELMNLGVSVYVFRIPRPDNAANETFHAKVVRVDDSECYVGSSNMTKWSFEYSLELGFHVRGSPASIVSRLLDAVVAVSARVHL